MHTIRKLHNNVKRDLISMVAKGDVLDIGCGRGGDLSKFKHCHEVSSVYMWDPDPDMVMEARKRSETLDINNVYFGVGDITKCPEETFDSICFNFSLQYIFKTEKLFQKSIFEIQKRMKKGGILFGCIPDSFKIITMTPLNDSYGNSVIRKIQESGNGHFGEKVFVKLDSPYYDNEYKAEPIAYKDYLIDELSKYSIFLKEWSTLTNDINCPQITKLYAKFIFVKI